MEWIKSIQKLPEMLNEHVSEYVLVYSSKANIIDIANLGFDGEKNLCWFGTDFKKFEINHFTHWAEIILPKE